MTYKNLRYSHKCSPEPPPVKKQAKPKPKAKQQPKPKPPPEVYYSDSEEEEHKPLSKPVCSRSKRWATRLPYRLETKF